MTLAGGDPQALTYRAFLDAGYALLVEAFVRLGADLVSAVDKAEESIGLRRTEGPAPEAPEAVPSAAENDRALAELQKLMGGVA